MKLKIFSAIALTASAYLIVGAVSVFAENIDPYEDDSQFAYGENIGWLNFEPNQGPGVTVSDPNLTGYVWAENIGWINLWPDEYGGVFNDGNGLLSGYGWSENAGWINFRPALGGVYIDACGDFNGWAWGENIGWINFGSETTILFRLTSEWVSPIDEVPPQTWPDIDIPEWFNTDVSFSLVTADCGSGTSEVHYTLDGGSEVVTAGSSASLNITGDGIYILTFFSIDVDGNIESAQEVIIQIDTTPPVITLNGPAAMTLECGIDSYAELGATVADNLDPAVAVVIGGDTVETSVCGVYNVTYDATDVAGNAAVQVVREVTVQDTIPPVISITSPADGTTYYVDEIILADFVVSDSGSGVDTVTSTVPNGSLIDTATAGAKTFTVSATDNASNSNTVSHSYTIIPRGNIDPYDDGSQYAYGENVGWLNFELGEGPGVTVSDSEVNGYIWAENIGWINLSPASYGGVLNDGTGQLSGYAWGQNVGWINFDPTVPGDPTDYGVSIDADGIFNGWAWGENIGWIHLRSETPIVYKVQTAWFIPNKPPVVKCQDVTVSAGPDCTADASVDDGSYDPDGDPITISQDPPGPYGLGDTDVTLTVTDDKGASEMCSATVTVDDTTPPEISGVPADVTVECDSVPAPANPTGTDNCDTDVPIVFAETRIDGGCSDSYVLTRIWTATDNCGNTTVKTQTITVQDTTPPVISGVPADVTVECDSVPAPANPTGTDNCDTDVPIVFAETRTDGGCSDSYVLTRTWTTTDNCGNTTVKTQTITVQDTTGPVIAGVPADVTVECDSVPAPANLTATDNCDPGVPVTFSEIRTDGDCPDNYTLTRTWTATDDCGNTTTESQIITVQDTTPPVITCPSDVVLECPADTSVEANGSATATDNCDDSPVITYDDVIPGVGNNETIIRTWTATDECGNSSSCEQIIVVEDTIAPELSVSVEPGVLWPVNHKMVLITPTVTVSDNCDESPEVTLVNITSSESDNVTGDGNTTDDIQIIDGKIYLRAERSGKGNGRVYTITYEAEDASGNTTQATATVTVPHDKGKSTK